MYIYGHIYTYIQIYLKYTYILEPVEYIVLPSDVGRG